VKLSVSEGRELRVYKLGRVEYEDGLALMRMAGAAVAARDPSDTDYLFLLEHPPVITHGRKASGVNVLASPAWLEQHGFEVHETDRGGDVTYHGPGQVVGYPVLDLSERRDVRRYVADLEEAMIRTCADQGIRAARHPEHRGAWVGTKKIGAVGVHLSRWISSHGFAFNVAPDMGHFAAIVPCGIADPSLGVTSLRAELEASGRTAPLLQEVEEQLAGHLAHLTGRRRVDARPDFQTVSVVPIRSDGRVLLLRRTPARGGLWQPVTGRMEEGETPGQAAGRELFEETGATADVDPLDYRHCFGVDPGLLSRETGAGKEPVPRRGGLCVAEETAFAARLPDGFEIRLSGEHLEYGWFETRDAIARLGFAGLKRAVRLASTRIMQKPR
jgi:lipoyl(octanoyl) transferase